MNTTNPTYRFVYKWRAFTYSLGITRIALLILSVGLFLLMAAQGQDIIIGLAERGVLVSPMLAHLLNLWMIRRLDFNPGYTLLLINGMITFAGLWLIRIRNK